MSLSSEDEDVIHHDDVDVGGEDVVSCSLFPRSRTVLFLRPRTAVLSSFPVRTMIRCPYDASSFPSPASPGRILPGTFPCARHSPVSPLQLSHTVR